MTGHSIVDAISSIHFEGNIIPFSWFDHLRFEGGKPDTNAILILSEIIYWYRLSTTRKESTGEVVGYKKKFYADKLQRTYQSFADQFGMSKRQASDAIDRLCDLHGVITREFRTVHTQQTTLSNVMYLEPIPSKVIDITHKNNTLLHSNVTGSYNETQEGGTFDCKTYTKTTTENTTENTNDYIYPHTSGNEIASKSVRKIAAKKKSHSVLVDPNAEWPSVDALVSKWNLDAPKEMGRHKLIPRKLYTEIGDFISQFPEEHVWDNIIMELHRSKFLRAANGDTTQTFKASLGWLFHTNKHGESNLQNLTNGKYRDAPREQGRSTVVL